MNANKVTALTVRIGGADGSVKTFQGRFAWALAHLLSAGDGGISTINRPAPRWSHYVFRLRREGVAIETITEPHGGIYRGHHGVYVLRSPVEILQSQEAGA